MLSIRFDRLFRILVTSQWYVKPARLRTAETGIGSKLLGRCISFSRLRGYISRHAPSAVVSFDLLHALNLRNYYQAGCTTPGSIRSTTAADEDFPSRPKVSLLTYL